MLLISIRLGLSLAALTGAFCGNMPEARADSISLDTPMAAASLHEGHVDMVVYFLDRSDHFEVVATFAARDSAYDPARLRMRLAEGDAVSFALPGHIETQYSFSRLTDVVTISANPIDAKFRDSLCPHVHCRAERPADTP